MWLFDDLLKKPSNETSTSGMGMWGQSSQSSGSTGNPPVQDPLAQAGIKIEKTEGTLLQTTPVFQNTTQVATTQETIPTQAPTNIFNPAEQNMGAEENVSSILINTNNATSITPSEILSPVQEVGPLVSQEEVAIQSSPSVPAEVPVAFEDSPIFWTTQIPASESSVTEAISVSWDALWLNNILGLSENQAVTENQEATPIETSVTQQEVENNSIAVNIEWLYTENNSWIEQEEESSTFTDPTAFIQDSLTKIDLMLEAMHAKHDTKLSEASGYKSEKERFAELETQAYRDADSMTTEMDHAERMKNYFTKELKHTSEKQNTGNPVESVETTLTTLAVKNSVEWVTEKKEAQKRAKAKMEV